MKKTVLKASAGTGKTYRLSLEYISALLRGFEPQDILVMTFTRKATSEIKERILLFLKDLTEDNSRGREISDNLKNLEPTLIITKEKVENICKKIFSSKDSLKIFTIDGFINLIFKSAVAPYKEIPSYQIIEDEENDEILAKVLSGIAENKKDFHLFKDFFIENIEKSWNSYIQALKPLFYERWKFILLNESNISTERIPFELGSPVAEFELLIESVKEICRLKEKEPTLDTLFKKKYMEYPLLGSTEEKESFLLNRAKDLVGENYFWNVRSCKKCKDEFEEARYEFEEFTLNLAKFYFNRVILPYERDIINLTKKIYTLYDEIKFKEKKFTHGDISSYTFSYFQDKKLNLKDENGLTPYFFSLIDSKAQVVFIDEFQDTSILQWKILKNIMDKAREVICVGDDKQSIYGWRGGEKKLFENLEKILDAQEKTLDRCYRSQSKIIDFTNSLFSKMSQNSSWNFSPVQGDRNKNKGYLNILTPEETPDEDDISGMDGMISILLSEFQGDYRNTAILARTKKHLTAIGEKLTEVGIPFSLESNEPLMNHRAVKPLFMLLKYFHYDNFLYLLEFLRSDLIGIGNPLMKKVIVNRENLGNIPEIEPLIKSILSFKEEFSMDGSLLSEKLFLFLKSFGTLDRFGQNSDLKNLYGFYELLGRYGSLDEFFKDFEKNPESSRFKQSSIEEKNAISLMTIHKSKGLEFHRVFYYHKVSKKSFAGKKALFYVQMDKNYEQMTAYLLASEAHNKILKHLKGDFSFIEEKETAAEEEEINNIYVALTRAVDTLYIVCEGKDDPLIDALNTLPSLQGNFIPLEKQEDPLRSPLINMDIDFTPPLFKVIEKEEENAEPSLEREFKKIVGTAVHFYLENIIYAEEQEFKKSYLLTMSKFGSSIGEEKLSSILKSSELKKFFKDNSHIFSKEWDMIYPEFEVPHGNKIKRLDRIMVKRSTPSSLGKIHIVDYKTGSLKEEQLYTYKIIIENYLKSIGEYNRYNVTTEFLKIIFLNQ